MTPVSARRGAQGAYRDARETGRTVARSCPVENVWLTSSLWIGLALLASLISVRFGVSVALVEIIVGMFGGNLRTLTVNPWGSCLAGVGSIVLTFLAGAEIDLEVVRKHFWPSTAIGLVGFFAPLFGVLAHARYACGWNWQQAQIAGLALSSASVAVVYAVLSEAGFKKTELGKLTLAACFVNNLGTVLALGILFANCNGWLALFAAATGIEMIAVFLLVKVATKFVRIWPLTKGFEFGNRDATYTTLLMSTGLTFGSICALFGAGCEVTGS